MTTAEILLAPKLVPVFTGDARYRVAHGGRGSSKTRGFATMTAVDGYRLGRSNVKGVILCGREHLNSLEESSMEEVKQAISAVPWLDAYYDIGEKYIRSKDRNISYVFAGLRTNVQALKSKARILRAWIDEAEGVSENAWRTLLPTVRAQGDWWQSEVWISYNPESRDAATHKRFRASPPTDAKIAQINWNDNPWFPEVLNRERLEDLEKRPDTYGHIWEGDFLTISDAQVFKDHFEVTAFTPEDSWNGPYHGLDFGYARDPTAATRVWIYNNQLFIEYEVYKKRLELDEIAPTLAREIPQIAMHTIRADGSRPDNISYLAANGLPGVRAAKKHNGSVADGIAHLKSYERIIVHPRCPNTAREFALHSYKVDRLSGDVLPIFIDDNNHAIDSIRYAIDPIIRFAGEPKVRVL